MATAVPQNSFVTELEAIAHVLKGETATSVQAEAIRQALVAALGRMDLFTGRRLRAQNYRTPLIVPGVAFSGGGVTLPADQAVRVGDEVFGPSTVIPVGAVLTAVTPPVGATMVPGGIAAGPATVTFGWRPIVLDGYGDATLILPHHPLLALWAVWTKASDGTLTAVDLTNASIYYGGPGGGDKATVELANSTLPKGTDNVIVECRAGVAAPTSTDPGGGESFYDLQQVLFSILQVNWQRFLDQPGDTLDESVGTQSSGTRLLRLPDGVKDVLEQYREIV